MRRFRRHRRGGAATVELAFVAPIFVVILVGLWEVGRLIQLKQVLNNAARDGARVAAQSVTINRTGTPTQIRVSTGDPNVKQTVLNYLTQAGLNLDPAQVTVTFAFLTGDTTKTEPFQGAKGQQFRVTVTIPTASLRWTTLGFVNPPTLSAEAVWTCLVDDPFTIDTTIPSW